MQKEKDIYVFSHSTEDSHIMYVCELLQYILKNLGYKLNLQLLTHEKVSVKPINAKKHGIKEFNYLTVMLGLVKKE